MINPRKYSKETKQWVRNQGGKVTRSNCEHAKFVRTIKQLGEYLKRGDV